MEFDVIVAGGGSAGVAAAVAAARTGARTLLVERNGVLGGMASAALVHSICGLYTLPKGDQPPTFANAGFAVEFARRLMAAGGASGPVRMGRVDVLLQRPVQLARLCDVFVRETPGLDLRLHAELVAAEAGSVTVAWRGCSERLHAKAFVDATGDAALAALRGAPCETETSKLQRPAYIFALAGVEPGNLDDDARLRLAGQITQAIKAKALPSAAFGAHFRDSPQPGECFVTIDLEGGPDYDPLDAACLSRLETEGREVAAQLAAFLQEEAAGFARSYIAAWPTRAGVRESRRIVGRYRLEAQDLESGAQFPDTIAFASWPMELRETIRGPRLRFPAVDARCGIPLRSLRAREDDALFIAGRCISCSHEAQASIRVIGTCLSTGEAAGLAAALQALGGPCVSAGILAARAKGTS